MKNERIENAISELNRMIDADGVFDFDKADAVADKYDLSNVEYFKLIFSCER